MGALTAAMAAAAKEAGAEIRTGAEVKQILVKNGRVTGVALANGEEIAAKVGSFRSRPAPHLPRPARSRPFAAEFCGEDAELPLQRDCRENKRRAGCAAHVRRAEEFLGRKFRVSRTNSHRPRHRLPRARLRRFQVRRIFARALSRHFYPVDSGYLARARGQARDVHLHAIRAVQIEARRLDPATRRVARHSAENSCRLRSRISRRKSWRCKPSRRKIWKPPTV